MRLISCLTLLIACAAPLAAETLEPAAVPGGAPFSDSILVIGEPIYLVPIPEGKAFEIAFKVGELEIEARPVFEATLGVHATCPDVSPEYCRKRVARLSLHTRELDDRVRVELRGMSRREMNKLGVEATIIVPERAPLIVKMGIGDLEIDAGPQDLQVGMSIGALAIRAPWEAFGSVGLSTRIGDASMRTVHDRHLEAKRKMLLGAKLKWAAGPGDSSIAVKLGIGDATVRLE